MKLDMELPEVRVCAITECAYNRDHQCCARAITVGDNADANCDTFFSAQHHTQSHAAAGVGACKIYDCIHNDDYECQAPSIAVDRVLGRAHCVTFSHR